MLRNRSRRSHQMSVVASTLEVCLVPHSPPDFIPFPPPSSLHPSFFLTRCPDSGIITMVGGEETEQVAGAISIGVLRWPPSNKGDEAALKKCRCVRPPGFC